MGYTNTPVSAIREFTVCDAKGWDCMGPHANDVHPNLAEFVNELRRAAPWLRFAVDRVIPYIREVYVYMDNHEYALGRVGYGDYAIRDTNTVYMVSSRNIKNGKVADWRSQHHMVQTEDLKRAVKSALKYLTPMSCVEIASESYDTFHSGIRETKNNKITQSGDLLSACRSASVFSVEFQNLLTQNVTFVTPEFQKAAREYKEAELTSKTAMVRKVGALFVRVRTMGQGDDNLMAEIINFKTDLIGKYYVKNVHPDNRPQSLVKMSDLSEDLQSKLATLSMMPENTYTTDLGMKVSDTLYWVEQDV
jgi:hypothetical protein